MRVIINAASIFKGGAEQVVNSFINECRNIEGNEYHIFLCDNILSGLGADGFPNNFYFYKLDKRPATSLYHIYKSLRYFDQLENKICPDLVISTGGHGYWRPKAPLLTGFNIPHYVYPESPYFIIIPKWKLLYWKIRKHFDLFFYKRSDAIVAQTDDVKERVKKLLPKVRVYTVSNTINSVFLNPPELKNKLPEKKRSEEIRLLTVSANYPHKNLEIIKSVLDALFMMDKKHIRFVLTLPEDVFNQFIVEKYRPFIYNVGPVDIKEVPSLYNECDMMFLPTLLECFSASYVEAMAMKKPIITSDLGFARQICGEAAVYFDPLDGKDIAGKIIQVAENQTLQKKLTDTGMDYLQNINSPHERAISFLKIGKRMIKK